MMMRFLGAFARLRTWMAWQRALVMSLILFWGIGLGLGAAPAWASLNDDHFDGNIFALYAGNGALVPPRLTLAQAIANQKPVVLSFFLDDCRDCKEFSFVLSQVQAYYGKATEIIPINVDSIPEQISYTPQEPGYYYKGYLPQTLILDAQGTVVFNQSGNIPFEKIDDKLREVFNLLPRSESVELRLKPVNELNSELVQSRNGPGIPAQ
jgi:hypothetical protein